ncbi:MAG: hypothetical protein MPF33_07855 [Candidatus Aramenus sp.]|jgi:hypothetical protein|nr:hypothetical protein [Candidatus Aramenus sp.]
MKVSTGKMDYFLDDVTVLYGEEVDDLVTSLSALDPTGYANLRRRVAWDLYFKASRAFSNQIREAFFALFELSAIVRELNFRFVNPSYALPSVVERLSTSAKLKWEKGRVTLKDPVEVEVEFDVAKEIGKRVKVEVDGKEVKASPTPTGEKTRLDLSRLTGVKGMFLSLDSTYDEGNLRASLNLEYVPEDRGMNKDVDVEELNKVLRVTAKEVNEKSIGSQSTFEDFMVSVAEVLVEPTISSFREELERTLGVREMVYIPPSRPFLLNASFSALTEQEVAQLFSSNCVMAMERVRRGKGVLSENSLGLKVDGGVVEYQGVQVTSALKWVKALATVILELASVRDRALIVIEAPEEYLTEDKRKVILEVLSREVEKGNKLLVSTWDRGMAMALRSHFSSTR